MKDILIVKMMLLLKGKLMRMVNGGENDQEL